MSEAVGKEILTREELTHLLSDSVGGGQGHADEHLAQRLPRASAVAAPRSGGDADLRLAIAQGAGAWGHRMASSYQRRIECSLIGWQEMDLADLAPAILDIDEAIRFSVGSEDGFVLMSRPLFSALHGLEFGAGSEAQQNTIPRRPFTGIERRLLTRLVRDLLGLLEGAWQSCVPHETRIIESCGRDRLFERAAGRVLLASLDVTALGVIGRLRIGLPAGLSQAAAAKDGVEGPSESQRLERGMVDVPLTLRAELGTLDLTLGQLAQLCVGDVHTIQPSAEEGLLIRVAGKPKFRAIAGQLGNRLAAQAVERL